MNGQTNASAAAPGRPRGRPVLGGVAGVFLGAFVWVDLVLLGVLAFASVAFWILPPVGGLLGWALARWTPIRRSARTVQPTDPTGADADGPADSAAADEQRIS